MKITLNNKTINHPIIANLKSGQFFRHPTGIELYVVLGPYHGEIGATHIRTGDFYTYRRGKTIVPIVIDEIIGHDA